MDKTHLALLEIIHVQMHTLLSELNLLGANR